MRPWKTRAVVFAICFGLGLLAALAYGLLAGLFGPGRKSPATQTSAGEAACGGDEYFAQPEDILKALKSEEVGVRREMFRRLFLRPGIATVYYDYERDRDYPERADQSRLRYVNLDQETGPEALLTFVRLEHPVALVLKKRPCGWKLIAALSAWLRLEQYPYDNWIETVETVEPGVSELLLRESSGDATYYVRKAHLLKLVDDSLRQVAEFEEELVRPLENYNADDWSVVRQSRVSRYDITRGSEGVPARLSITTTDEVIKYTGSAPLFTYWLETDGAWHAARRHWRTSPARRVRRLGTSTERLVWNEHEKRFSRAGAS